MTLGAGRPAWPEAYLLTSATDAELVSSTTGMLSSSAEATRWSCTPNCGTDSGTAMKPA